MDKMNIENYTSDTPISKNSDDRFQRYGFAKRIADTIKLRKDPNSLVIGIYGSWGEGKTSVINFIESELQANNDVVICKFNPWRFKEEGQLLASFFSLLAKQLGKSILTKKENIAKQICDYGEAISFGVGGLETGKLFELYKSKKAVDIDEQKKRIEEILQDSKKKIVVFIDDIDRLEKKEIQSIFKLIKLTGDFYNTTYVLAFDQLMVAKAIGENYEDGTFEAGRNYLEKIIQVPLHLPAAQTTALRQYCINRINRAIDSNNIDVSKEDGRRFLREFNENILKKISTPRMAVRYSNAVSFALPLLDKEVNVADLLLIEAIKVFYSDVYIFIRNNSHYFIRSYESAFINSDNSENQERKKNAKTDFERLISQYPSEDRKAIKELLTELFPIFRQVFQGIGYGEGSYQNWHDEKRIGSPQYFDRYFAYTVLEGEISDVEYESFISAVKSNDDSSINEYLTKVDTGQLAIKMMLFKAESFDENLSKKLIKTFAKYANKFSRNENALTGLDTALGKLAIVIYKLVENISSNEDKLKVSIEFVRESVSFELADDFFTNFKRKIDMEEDDKYFNDEQINSLAITLLQKAKDEAKEIPIFERFPHSASYLISKIWSPILGTEDVMNYLKSILNNDPSKLVLLLKAYSPFTHSSNFPVPYFGELQDRTYDSMAQTLDCEFLYDLAIKLMPDSKIDTYISSEGEPSDEKRIEQFIYLHQKSKKNSDAELIIA